MPDPTPADRERAEQLWAELGEEFDANGIEIVAHALAQTRAAARAEALEEVIEMLQGCLSCFRSQWVGRRVIADVREMLAQQPPLADAKEEK